jgi:thioredoxin family protein
MKKKERVTMKKQNRILFILGIVIACMAMVELYGRVRTLQSEHEVEQRIIKAHILVIMFYKSGKEERNNNALKQSVKDLLRMYDNVSSKKLYDDADITFAKINVDKKGSESMMQQYDVTALPSFVLFNNGRSVTDQAGKVLSLTGFVKSEQLQSFIEDNLNQDIEKTIEAKEEDRDRRIEAAQVQTDPYFYPATYYTPYYGYAPYWGRPAYPGFGFGVGWGYRGW